MIRFHHPAHLLYAVLYRSWIAWGRPGKRPSCHACGIDWQAAALIRWAVEAALVNWDPPQLTTTSGS